jgi:membrane-associated phospholipid phosphatase
MLTYRSAMTTDWRVATAWITGVAGVSAAVLLLFVPFTHATPVVRAIDAIPSLVRSFLDLHGLLTPDGFVDAILFGWVAPFAFMWFSIRLGSLLALRDARASSTGVAPRFASADAVVRIGALATWMVALAFAIGVGVAMAARLSGIDVPVANLASAVAGGALLGLNVGLVTLIVGMLTRSVGAAAAVGTIAGLGADALNGMAMSVRPLTSFRYASIAYYAESGAPVARGVPASHLLTLLVAAALLAFLAALLARRTTSISSPASRPGDTARRVWLRVRATPRPTALAAAVAVLAALAFGWLADAVRDGETIAPDPLATQWLHGLATPALDAVMNGLTFLGSTPFAAAVLIVAGACLLGRRRWRDLQVLIVTIGGSVTANEVLKVIVHRARPQLSWAPLQPDFSFPSGHAMNALALYVALALILGASWTRGRRLAAVLAAVLLAIAIGVSRVYLGDHYLSDVVAGWIAGVLWLLAVKVAFLLWDAAASTPQPEAEFSGAPIGTAPPPA